MSKMGNAVFEGQEFASENCTRNASAFQQLAEQTFGLNTVQYDSAMNEFNVIQNDLFYFDQYMAMRDRDESRL